MTAWTIAPQKGALRARPFGAATEEGDHERVDAISEQPEHRREQRQRSEHPFGVVWTAPGSVDTACLGGLLFDTDRLLSGLPVLSGGGVAERGVATFAVVERVDELEDRRSRLDLVGHERW